VEQHVGGLFFDRFVTPVTVHHVFALEARAWPEDDRFARPPA
jgi:hypothetical protein